MAIIDLAAGGIFAAILGDHSKIIKNALKRVKVYCSYAPHRQDYWRDRYISMIKEFTGFESVALFSTGSEATEAFWRVCRVYNGKPGVWGGLIDPDEVGVDKPMCDSFHGMTLGALIMAGRQSWHEIGCFPEFNQRFGMSHESTGCMIMEPYHAPSAQFHRIEPTINRVKLMTETFPDIPLCLDEVQGGFGRTGKLWAHEHYVDNLQNPPVQLLKPSFITCGKLMGGGLPLAALIGPKEIMESAAVKEFGHLHSTHSGNPLMCSVGCAVIEEMQRSNLVAESARKGEILHEMLGNLPLRKHGKGLLAGIEFAERRECEMAVARCRDRCIGIVDTGRKWIKIGPALSITDETLIKGMNILREVVEEIIHERETAPCGDSGGGLGRSGEDLQVDGVQTAETGTSCSPEDGGRSRADN